MTIEIRPLEKRDDREDFDCGQEDLNHFLRRFAGQNQFKHHIGTTWVAVEDRRILGFATVSAVSIEVDELSEATARKLPAYPLPVLRLARLGVSVEAQGRGLGKHLLRHVFELSLEMKRLGGCVGVVVDAKPEAVEFYRRYGFEPLGAVLEGTLIQHPAPLPMFMPIGTILKAIPAR